MADITSQINGGMFDSTEITETPGGFPRGNKAVSSDFFAKMISSFYADGVLSGDGFSVTPAGGMDVTVHGGIAWARGYMAFMDDDRDVTLSAGKSYAVLVRLNTALGEFSLVVTESVSSLPTRTESVCDLVVAEIIVPSGTLSVTDAMITDTRAATDKCGFVRNAIDALGEALHAGNADRLGGEEADAYLKRSGGRMTGVIFAASAQNPTPSVRNISYGTQVPATLPNGDVFILVND